MRHKITKISLPKAATVGKAARTVKKLLKTVKKPQSPVQAKILIRPATSAGIMDMMFHFGRKDQQRLKKSITLSRKSQLPKNKSRKSTP
jgi:hypothetical protein